MTKACFYYLDIKRPWSRAFNPLPPSPPETPNQICISKRNWRGKCRNSFLKISRLYNLINEIVINIKGEFPNQQRRSSRAAHSVGYPSELFSVTLIHIQICKFILKSASRVTLRPRRRRRARWNIQCQCILLIGQDEGISSPPSLPFELNFERFNYAVV